jgi:hypothetical protein
LTAHQLFEAGRDKQALAELMREKRLAGSDTDRIASLIELASAIQRRSEGRLKRKAASLVNDLSARLREAERAHFRLRYQVHFDDLEVAMVSLRHEPTPNQQLSKEAETLLFCLYAASQIANLGGAELSTSLASLLHVNFENRQRLSELIRSGPGDFRVTPVDQKIHIKTGFQAILTHPATIKEIEELPILLNRVDFALEPKGFSRAGEGVSFYAPASALVLLYLLARRRATDSDFLERLAKAASALGALGSQGEISTTNQILPALSITVRVWRGENLARTVGTDRDDRLLPSGTPREVRAGPDPALRILRERYARGQITRDEFKRMEADLLDVSALQEGRRPKPHS